MSEQQNTILQQNPISQKRNFLSNLEKQIGSFLIRTPAHWYEYSDLLLAYKQHATLPEFVQLIDAFRQSREAFGDPTKYHIFLPPETRKYWETTYWSEATSLPATDIHQDLRGALARVLARLDVKEILAQISERIEEYGEDIEPLSAELLRAFHRITPKEGLVTWEEVPRMLKVFIDTKGGAKAFPFPFLEEALGFPVDIFRRDVTVVMGRTGRGKTTLSINVAKVFVESGYNVCYISTEMSEDAVVTKLISAVTDVEWRYLYGRDFNHAIASEALAKFTAFQEKCKGKMFIYHKARCTVSDIAAAVASTKGMYGGVDLVVVDYIQQVESGVRRQEDTRAYELAQIVGELADISAYNNCAVMVVSQVNSQGEVKDARAIEERAGLAVRLGMLSEKAFIDEVKKELRIQDKLLPKEVYEFIRAQYKRVLDVEVKKNRYGVFDPQHKYLRFDGSRCKVLGAWTDYERENWLKEVEALLRGTQVTGKAEYEPSEDALEDEEFMDF